MATRRSFIAVAGSTSLAAWAVIGNLHIARAADTGETLTLRTLTRMARLIYPHDALSDSVYAGIVGTLLEDQQNQTLFQSGVANLDGFLELTEEDQLDRLRMLEKSKFFDGLKVPLMWALYNKRELWDQIGYPGPSIPFGGYINRGFNDINWLPT